MRRLLYWTSYGLYLAGFVLLVAYLGFHRPFVETLRHHPRPEGKSLHPPRHVTAEEMRLVGSILVDRESSFVRFEQAKPAGVLRLCAFGDSFTLGDEAGPSHDYPSLLQRAFETIGADNVQVLNFGSSWHGFHQSFILWERVGARFACDALLLGPASFQPERELHFNHTWHAFPYYLHARYVLDGDGVRLVAPAGQTAGERFEQHYRFFPRAQTWRYDRNPPAPLQAVLGLERTIANPFYYDDRDATAEAQETYRRLLRKMADSGVPIVLTHRERAMVELARELELERAAIAPSMVRLAFPHFAPSGHNSAWGNARVAAQVLSLLVEDAPAEAAVLAMVEGEAQAAADRGTPRALGELAAIEAWVGHVPAGVLTATGPPGGEYRPGKRGLLADTQARMLVAVVTGDVQPVDAAYVPVTFDVKDGDRVELVVTGGAGGHKTSTLAAARRPDPTLPLAIVRVPAATFHFRGQVVLAGGAAETLAGLGTDVTLSIAGHEVLRAPVADGVVDLLPVAGPLYRFVPALGLYEPVTALAERGDVRLVFYPRGGEVPRALVIGEYARRAQAFPQPVQELERKLRVSAGQARWN